MTFCHDVSDTLKIHLSFDELKKSISECSLVCLNYKLDKYISDLYFKYFYQAKCHNIKICLKRIFVQLIKHKSLFSYTKRYCELIAIFTQLNNHE